MRTRRMVAAALAWLGLATRVTVGSAQVPELTSLNVCNEGRDTVFAVTATPGGGHLWQALGWMEIPPDGCNNVYSAAVPNVDPGNIGFAVRGPNGRLTSVSANEPAYGDDGKGNPTFSSRTQSVCALPHPEHISLFKSDAADDSAHCGDWVNKKIDDLARSHYAAYDASLYFRPKLDCGVLGCGPGSYYLSLRHPPGSSSVILARGLSPNQKSLKSIGQFLVAMAKAGHESEIARQKAELQTLQNRFARYKPGSAASWAEQWASAPRLSPADYDSTQKAATAIFAGTISRYSVDTRHFPQWITIYFNESPSGAFVVCSPYPDMFQEVVGLNLNALIGKQLEVVGPVEAAICTAEKTGGSVRVLESGMFHLR